jgi:hypothetical protein
MNVPNQNPIYLAEKAQQMASKTKGGRGDAFQNVAVISMCVVAATAATQMLLQVYRELTRREERHKGRGR